MDNSSLHNTLSYRMLDRVVIASSAALALEVTASPKPGNIHRFRDAIDTRFEHFIISSFAVIPVMSEAVRRGYLLSLHVLDYSSVEIGFLIYNGVRNARMWHRGGNTNLGTMTLMVPLVVAVSAVLSDYRELHYRKICGIARKLVEDSTEDDAIYFYKAIRVVKPSYLGRLDYWGLPEVFDPLFEVKIRRKGITLLDILKPSSLWDIVMRELYLGYINILGPYIQVYKKFNKAYDWNTATILTFLYILSNEVDSIIRRKHGLTLALRIQSNAREALKKAVKENSINPVFELDRLFTCLEVNPGSVADFLAPIIMIGLLEDIKP